MLSYTAYIPVGIDVDVSANLQKPILSQIPEFVGLSPILWSIHIIYYNSDSNL